MASSAPSRHALVRDLCRLIRIDSVSRVSSVPAGRVAAALLKKAGFRVSIQRETVRGVKHVNVIGVKGYGNGGLLLCSHMDTVPPGDLDKWTRTGGDPWNPRVSGGRVWGLGSADDKGPLVSMIHAGARWKESELRRPLVVMASYGEEHGMGGARLFVRRWKGPKPAAAFVGEPTSLGLTYRHKGMGVLTVTLVSRERRKGVDIRNTFSGKQGHSSRPWTGDNALDKAAAFLRGQARNAPSASVVSLQGGFAANLIPDRAVAVLRVPAPGGGGPALPVFPCAAVSGCVEAVRSVVKRRARSRDRLLKPPVLTSNFGIAETRGAELTMTFDFRLLPGQSIAAIRAEADRAVRARLRGSGIKFRVAIERDNPPLGLTAGHPLVRRAAAVLRKKGFDVHVGTKPSCTEAGIYAAWDIPAVIFGPGDAAGNIHAPNESVAVEALVRGVRCYDELIRAFCAPEMP